MLVSLKFIGYEEFCGVKYISQNLSLHLLSSMFLYTLLPSFTIPLAFRKRHFSIISCTSLFLSGQRKEHTEVKRELIRRKEERKEYIYIYI
jgi:hypothetical protein